jgi:hypothetical protein
MIRKHCYKTSFRYFVERTENGAWKSVFPEHEAECAQTHNTVRDALHYLVGVLGHSARSD